MLPITGSLVVRARFGTDPTFILAVGGFHPRFTDLPPGIPPQDRVGIQLDYGIVTVRIVGYVAITSNTFQTGAEASPGRRRWRVPGGGVPRLRRPVHLRAGVPLRDRLQGRRIGQVQEHQPRLAEGARHPLRARAGGRSRGTPRSRCSSSTSTSTSRSAGASAAAPALPGVTVSETDRDGARRARVLARRSCPARQRRARHPARRRRRRRRARPPAGRSWSVLQKVVPLGIDIDRVGRPCPPTATTSTSPAPPSGPAAGR